MTDYLKPISTETLSDFFGLVQRHSFELRRRDGTWQRQVRETYDRGDGAAVLICDAAKKSVILVRQFRFPAHYRGENPYVIEVCAGKLEGDDPETCIRKEALEETGLKLGRVEKIFDSFMSPGSVTERLTLFHGWVDENAQLSAGGGLDHEGEDIEVLNLPFAKALEMVGTGEIADAKTIMLLQHAALSGLFA